MTSPGQRASETEIKSMALRSDGVQLTLLKHETSSRGDMVSGRTCFPCTLGRGYCSPVALPLPLSYAAIDKSCGVLEVLSWLKLLFHRSFLNFLSYSCASLLGVS